MHMVERRPARDPQRGETEVIAIFAYAKHAREYIDYLRGKDERGNWVFRLRGSVDIYGEWD